MTTVTERVLTFVVCVQIMGFLKMLINTKQLSEWTGLKQKSAIIRLLDQYGVGYFLTPSGEICCTEEAINSRLIGGNYGQKKTEIKFTPS